MTTKLCIFCLHCQFDEGFYGTDVTPGYSASIECYKRTGKDRKAPMDDREDFVKWNQLAESCPHYNPPRK